jgi:hypothetical protein
VGFAALPTPPVVGSVGSLRERFNLAAYIVLHLRLAGTGQSGKVSKTAISCIA